MKEIWKDINGWEGLYKISNLGRVYSVRNKIILKPSLNKKGYLYVHFSTKDKKKNYTIHRLVAKAYIPNVDNLPQVNHKDENKENNCVNNLEWISNLDNINYGTRNIRIAKALKGKEASEECKRKIHNSKLGHVVTQETKEKLAKALGFPVKCIETNCIYFSTMEAERNTGVDHSHISRCCKGKAKTAGGFHWEYINSTGT